VPRPCAAADIEQIGTKSGIVKSQTTAAFIPEDILGFPRL
jgi:hypothetical protein